MNGVLIINKPSEFTSFDVVAIIRKLSMQRKIGHTGTLDPMATGVLPLLLGRAAKAQSLLPDTDKEYRADFKLGISTDTLDIWGKIVSENESHVTKSQAEAALDLFRGEINQVPPMYSAVRQNGKRLYELARQGIEVERKERKVVISRLVLEKFDEQSQTGTLKVSCSKGTYIRSLIDDLGKSLGTTAVMSGLCRVSACGFDLSQAIDLEEIRKDPSLISSNLLSTESLFTCYPEIQVSEAQSKRFINGGDLDVDRLRCEPPKENQIFRIKSNVGEPLGLAKALSSGSLHSILLFSVAF